jgi:hypothetical protein
VSVKKRKVERYREALGQAVLCDFPVGAHLLSVGVLDLSSEIRS